MRGVEGEEEEEEMVLLREEMKIMEMNKKAVRLQL